MLSCMIIININEKCILKYKGFVSNKGFLAQTGLEKLAVLVYLSRLPF